MPHVMDRKLLTILQKKSADGNKWGPTEDEFDNYSEITVQSDICVGLNASVHPQLMGNCCGGVVRRIHCIMAVQCV